jgi:hypothetical protein
MHNVSMTLQMIIITTHNGGLNMSKDCIICGSNIPPHKNEEGVVYWEGGHNAEPYASGRCCDLCHDLLVIPSRLKQMREEKV